MMIEAMLARTWWRATVSRHLLSLLLLASSSYTQATEMTFAVIDSPPFGVRLKDDSIGGLYPAILKALGKASGIRMTLVLVPFARAASQVSTGNVQGTLMLKTAGTDGRTVPLAPLFESGMIVQSRPGCMLRRRADLTGRLIGRIRGGCHALDADSSQRWRFYEINNQEQGIAMLAAGRIDAFCTTPEAFAFAVDGVAGAPAIDVSERITLSIEKVWLLVHPSVSAEVRGRLVGAVARLKEDGQLAEIFRQQLGRNYSLRLAK